MVAPAFFRSSTIFRMAHESTGKPSFFNDSHTTSMNSGEMSITSLGSMIALGSTTPSLRTPMSCKTSRPTRTGTRSNALVVASPTFTDADPLANSRPVSPVHLSTLARAEESNSIVAMPSRMEIKAPPSSGTMKGSTVPRIFSMMPVIMAPP